MKTPNKDAEQKNNNTNLATINAATAKEYEDRIKKGIEGSIIWDATFDRDTRTSHGLMDGKKRKDDGLFDGPGEFRAPYPGWEGLPPEERDGCRCTLRFEIEGYPPQMKRTKEDGIIEFMTWEEWAKGKGWTIKKGWPDK